MVIRTDNTMGKRKKDIQILGPGWLIELGSCIT